MATPNPAHVAAAAAAIDASIAKLNALKTNVTASSPSPILIIAAAVNVNIDNALALSGVVAGEIIA